MNTKRGKQTTSILFFLFSMHKLPYLFENKQEGKETKKNWFVNWCNSNPCSFWEKMVALKRIFGAWKLICVFSLHLVQLLPLSWWPFWAWLWPFSAGFLIFWLGSHFLPGCLFCYLYWFLCSLCNCRFLGCLHPFFIYFFNLFSPFFIIIIPYFKNLSLNKIIYIFEYNFFSFF